MCVCILRMVVVVGVVSVDLRKTRQFFDLSRFVGIFVENGN